MPSGDLDSMRVKYGGEDCSQAAVSIAIKIDITRTSAAVVIVRGLRTPYWIFTALGFGSVQAISSRRRSCVGIFKRLNIVELAVVHVDGAVRRFFEDVAEGCVPSYIGAGILAPRHQCLARVLVGTT
jgi:hypothetical protein